MSERIPAEEKAIRLIPHPAIYSPDLQIFDIEETPSHYLLRLDVHMVLGERVRIELTDEALHLRGSHEAKSKRVSLRVDATHHSITAHYHEGTLTISLPKDLEARRQIGRI